MGKTAAQDQGAGTEQGFLVCFVRRKDGEGPIALIPTADPPHALSILQLGSPEELKLLGAVDANRYPAQWWHDVLSPWHVRGLWYEPKAQVTCRMEDALRGVPDDPRLPSPPEVVLEAQEATDGAPDSVPSDLRERLVEAEKKARQQVRDKWAWPEVDPYPIPASISNDKGLDLGPKKAILSKLRRATKSSSTAPNRS